MPPGHVQLVGETGVDLELDGGITYIIQAPPGGAGKRCWREGPLEYPAQPAATETLLQITRRRRLDSQTHAFF